MSVIALLIAVSLIVAIGFLAAFLWAVKTGQYNDTYTPSVRILFDDGSIEEKNKKDENKGNNIDNNLNG